MIKSANDLMTSFCQFQLDGGKYSDMKIIATQEQGFSWPFANSDLATETHSAMG